MTTAQFYRAPQAALVAGVHRSTLTNAVWGGKIPGARMEGGQWLLPAYSLHLAGYLTADDTGLPGPDADHLPGLGLYYTRHTYAAEAVGVGERQLREWLVTGQVPGAYQPRGPRTAWAVPVDGLWAAGLVPRFTIRDGRAQGKLEVMEADPSGRAYSLPPLGTLLATAARALERPMAAPPAPAPPAPVEDDAMQLDVFTEHPDPTPPSAPAPADSHLHELVDAQRQVIDLQRQLAEVRAREQAREQALEQVAEADPTYIYTDWTADTEEHDHAPEQWRARAEGLERSLDALQREHASEPVTEDTPEPAQPQPEDVPEGEVWLIRPHENADPVPAFRVHNSKYGPGKRWAHYRLGGSMLGFSDDEDVTLVSRLVPEVKA